LLARPVRVEGILLGHVVDVVLDRGLARAPGLEVRCGDGEHRFLPFAGARLLSGEVSARTALALLDAPELAFYARRGTTLRTLRRAGEEVDDVEVDEGGSIQRLHLAGEGAWRPVAA
jgi:hypothetical protein